MRVAKVRLRSWVVGLFLARAEEARHGLGEGGRMQYLLRLGREDVIGGALTSMVSMARSKMGSRWLRMFLDRAARSVQRLPGRSTSPWRRR